MGFNVSALADAAPEVAVPSAVAVISVDKLVHRYENRTALNGVSFDVRAAELFGLLGPNGSGKTTLFRILSTLMLPTAGRATILGFDAAQEPARLRRQIGVVFQAQSVDLKLTAYENLWHQGHLYGLRGSALKERIHEILSRVGLADRAKELVETFSGGMQRRIELAKGLFIIRACYYWMSRPRASIPAPAAISGNTCKRCATRSMFPSSSPRISWKRPSAVTAWPS